MTEFISSFQSMNPLSNKIVDLLKKQIDNLYEQIKPGPDGVSYYECESATDAGYWHDSAQRIFNTSAHTKALFQHAMDKFVRAIAKRLFYIECAPHKKLTYNYHADRHHFEHDDDWHVIVRLEQGKPLIFFCATDQQPQNCIACTRARALGKTVPYASPYAVVASEAPENDQNDLEYREHDPKAAADAARQREQTFKNRGRPAMQFSQRQKKPQHAARSVSPSAFQRKLDEARANDERSPIQEYV
jgi:hypothetical protein